MSRRLLLGLLAAAVMIAVVVALRKSSPGGLRTGADGPVIFISIDTLRADRLPAYGGTVAKTPNIDRLAADGVVFDNAYAHSPQTLPSHTSILSGALPYEHGVRDNIGFTVKPGQRFLQHALKEIGYATGGFISSYVLRAQTGLDQGFDTFDANLPPASPEQPLGEVQRRGEETLAAAWQWIGGRSSPKFFLFAHIYEPHTPYTPPARYGGLPPYEGEVAYSDEIVGTLLDRLRQANLYEGALIALFSDHGEGLGDHGEEEHGIFLYRETIRVPLIVKLPGAEGRGRRVAAPVQHVDLVPTVLELTAATGAGGAPPGRSLVPALTGSGELKGTAIYSEALSPRYHFGWSELYALSDERYRFIRAPREELYDLARDPNELTSIAAARQPLTSAMRGRLEALVAGRSVAPPAAVSAEDRQKLAALGYVGTQTGSRVRLPGDQLADPKDKMGVLKAYREAARLAAAQQNADASRAYRQLLREDPEITDAWLRLAEVSIRQGLFGEAHGAFAEVIKRDPKNAAALTGAAAALLRAGRIDEARAHAELAIGVAPAIAHEMLARIAVHRRDAAAARQHAGLAEQADATLPMRKFIEALIAHAQGQYATAAALGLEAKQVMSARTEQLADLNYVAGDSLARLERHQEAEELFKAELRLFPGHVRARSALAMLYKATGRDAEASRAVEDLVRYAPNSEGIAAAAQLWTLFGEPVKAARLRRPPPR